MPARALAVITPKLKDLRKQYLNYLQAVQELGKAEQYVAERLLQEMRIEMLYYLAGISAHWTDIFGFTKKARRKRAFMSLYADEVVDVLKTTHFLLESQDRTREPWPYISIGNCKYYGPGNDFKNITGAELHFSSLLMTRYLEGNDDALYELLGIFYRPAGKSPKYNPNHALYGGDIREPFNEQIIERRGKKMRHLPKSRAITFFFYYQCFRQRLQKYNPEIFTKSNEAQAQSEGWLPIFRQLAQHPLRLREVAQMRLGEILMELRENLREAQEKKSKKTK